MRQGIARLIAVIVMAAAWGCSSPPPADIAAIEAMPPKQGMARLVFYYPKYWGGTRGLVQARLPEHKAACRFNSGNYLVSEVQAGEQTVAFSFCGMAATSFLRIKAVASQTYYFRVWPYDSSITGKLAGYPSEAPPKPGEPPHKGPFLIERIDEPEALEEIEPLTEIKGY